MNLKTNRNLVVFDLEATGLKISEAKIISVGAIKLNPKGEVIDQFEVLINPMEKLSDKIVQLTGIHNETLKKESNFLHVAQRIVEFFEDCDLAGFNLTRFDLPLLSEEFARTGIFFPEKDTRIIDAQVIYHTKFPRNLSAALFHYCQKEHTNAHDAMGDTIATLEVLTKQLEVHPDISNEIEELHTFSMRGKAMADWTRMFYYDDKGALRYNFSKHKDKLVFQDSDTLGFAYWMLGKDFPRSTLLFIGNVLEEYEQSDRPTLAWL